MGSGLLKAKDQEMERKNLASLTAAFASTDTLLFSPPLLTDCSRSFQNYVPGQKLSIDLPYNAAKNPHKFCHFPLFREFNRLARLAATEAYRPKTFVKKAVISP